MGRGRAIGCWWGNDGEFNGGEGGIYLTGLRQIIYLMLSPTRLRLTKLLDKIYTSKIKYSLNLKSDRSMEV